MFRALEANVPERLTQFGIKNSVNTDPPEGRLTPVSHLGLLLFPRAPLHVHV